MIIALIVGGLFLAGIGMILWYNSKPYADSEWRLDIGALLMAINAAIGVIIGTIIIVNTIAPEHKFEQDMIEYNVLQYEEENGYISFAEDVVDYNHKVNNYKKWANNPWVNWFYYDGCEDLPYYELKGVNK